MTRLPALLLALLLLPVVRPHPVSAQGRYRNFSVAIYVTVAQTHRLADPRTFAREFERINSQLRFDKVYVEAYRDRDFATDAELEAVKQAFAARGVRVSGGVTLSAGGQGGQFGTFDYESPADRAECQRAVELVARHFDQVILDDFFFYTSKSDADIAAKGPRSWTQYRLDTMREAARKLVLEPARRVNPKVKLIIKYPNWYEHFQGLGYDLDQEAHAFDATPASVHIVLPGEGVRLRNIVSDVAVPANPAIPPAAGPGGVARRPFGPRHTTFTVQLEPHSYQVYRIET